MSARVDSRLPEAAPPSPSPSPEGVDRKALLVLLAGGCIIGVGPILVRLGEAGPSAIGMWRLGFALPLLALLALSEQRRGGVSMLRAPAIAWVTGVFFAFDLAFWHYGIRFTTVANATVLSNLTPVLVALSAWLFLRERPTSRLAAGLVLAVGGVIAMGLARPAVMQPDAKPVLGDLLSAFTAVWYTAYFLCVRRARETMGAATVMLTSSLCALPLLLIAALLLGEPLMPHSALGWAALVGLGLMHVSGQGAIAWSLGRLPAALIAVVVLVQPVIAALLGWAIFGEAVTPVQAVGALVALTGIVLAQSTAKAKSPAAPAEA